MLGQKILILQYGCVIIQMTATEQYFPVVLFIMLYKVTEINTLKTPAHFFREHSYYFLESGVKVSNESVFCCMHNCILQVYGEN